MDMKGDGITLLLCLLYRHTQVWISWRLYSDARVSVESDSFWVMLRVWEPCLISICYIIFTSACIALLWVLWWRTYTFYVAFVFIYFGKCTTKYMPFLFMYILCHVCGCFKVINYLCNKSNEFNRWYQIEKLVEVNIYKVRNRPRLKPLKLWSYVFLRWNLLTILSFSINKIKAICIFPMCISCEIYCSIIQ